MTAIETLTEQQRTVLWTLAMCHGSTKQAAHRLGRSRATIRNHRTDIYARLNVSGFYEALTKVGWVRVPPAPGYVSTGNTP